MPKGRGAALGGGLAVEVLFAPGRQGLRSRRWVASSRTWWASSICYAARFPRTLMPNIVLKFPGPVRPLQTAHQILGSGCWPNFGVDKVTALLKLGLEARVRLWTRRVSISFYVSDSLYFFGWTCLCLLLFLLYGCMVLCFCLIENQL